MTSRSTFRRKIHLLLAIGLLLPFMYWLSNPATKAAKGAKGSPGGVLAQLREKYHLSQSELGQVDPTSVALKLSTLGLRSVAANILWMKHLDYQMKKDWTNSSATLNQITKIQPNFINVWINQSWNLSYNISHDFDDYRERYRWVIKGFEFLQKGMAYNEREARLPYEMGRMVSQKIGKADESVQFRRLLREDNDFRDTLPSKILNPSDIRYSPVVGAGKFAGRIDNWLLGKTWYKEAQEMIVRYGVGMMDKNPLIALSCGPLCQMYYSDALEKEGTFGEVAKAAWTEASREWQSYGDADIPTGYVRTDSDEPVMIRLSQQEYHEAEAKKLLAQLEALQPGLRKKIVDEKRATLTDAQLKALDTPAEKRSGKEYELAMQAEQIVYVAHDEVARRLTGQKLKEKGLQLAREAANHEQYAVTIRRYRDTVNYITWRDRAKIEQSSEMLDAKRFIHQADQAYAEGSLIPAKEAYEQGMQAWRRVLDANPGVISDLTTGEELVDAIKSYRRTLKSLEMTLPKDFILQDVLDLHENPGTSGAK